MIRYAITLACLLVSLPDYSMFRRTRQLSPLSSFASSFFKTSTFNQRRWMSMSRDEAFKLYGLDESSKVSGSELKKAWAFLQGQCHPDKNQALSTEATKRSAQINEAFTIINNAMKEEEADKFRPHNTFFNASWRQALEQRCDDWRNGAANEQRYQEFKRKQEEEKKKQEEANRQRLYTFKVAGGIAGVGALVTAFVYDQYQKNKIDIFLQAAKDNDVPLLQRLMGSVGVNATDRLGNTALHYAVLNGHTEMVKFLANQENIELSCENNEEKTPFIIAEETGNEALFNELIAIADVKNGITVPLQEVNRGKQNLVEKLWNENIVQLPSEDQIKKNEEWLQYSIAFSKSSHMTTAEAQQVLKSNYKQQRNKIKQMLIDTHGKISTTIRTYSNATTVEALALAYKDYEMVSLAIKKSSSSSSLTYLDYHLDKFPMLMYQSPIVIRFLKNRGARTTLAQFKLAINSNFSGEALVALASSINDTDYGTNALHHICEICDNFSVDQMRSMLEGLNPGSTTISQKSGYSNRTPIEYIETTRKKPGCLLAHFIIKDIEQGNAITKQMLDRNQEKAALIEGILKGNKADLETYIKKGYNVNESLSKLNITLLHRSVDYGQVEITEELLKHGANVSASTTEGATPIFFAETRLIAQLLKKYGACTDVKGNQEMSLVHNAMNKGYESDLIEEYADEIPKIVPDKNGNTPWHYLAMECNNSSKETLIAKASAYYNYNQKLNVSNASNKYPEEIARDKGSKSAECATFAKVLEKMRATKHQQKVVEKSSNGISTTRPAPAPAPRKVVEKVSSSVTEQHSY